MNRLSEQEVQAICAPIERARTFPNRAYTDAGYFAWEVDKIFHNGWVAIGFENQIDAPGSVHEVDVCGAPLLLTRDRDSVVHVLHNVCPYDGSKLFPKRIDGETRLSAIYHGWIYDLDGRFVEAPNWYGRDSKTDDDFGDFCPHLRAAACESFNGIIFANLGVSPAPFADYIQPLKRAFEDYTEDLALHQNPDGSPHLVTNVWEANWKIVGENYINTQHTHHVHFDYINSPDMPALDEDGGPGWVDRVDEHFFGLYLPYEDFVETYGDWAGKPGVGRDTDRPGPPYASYSMLFPNLYICVEGASIILGVLLPDGPERTVATQAVLANCAIVDEPACVTEMREAAVDGYELAYSEDKVAVKTVQQGKHSPVVNSGFYAPFWDRLHYSWNRLIVDELMRD